MKKTWDKTFIEIAELFAQHSTCQKRQVGAVLIKNKRIISCGYNGTPSGMPHCNSFFKSEDECKIPAGDGFSLHHKFSAKYELHAEQNCIAFAAKTGIPIDDDCTLYVTTAPCTDCAKLIVAAGIKKVVYKYSYKNSDGVEFLREANVEIVKED